MTLNPIVLIPARMASTRLPDKPLADIAGLPMIVHVLRRSEAAGIGPVYVATDSDAVMRAVEAAGGKAVMTGGHHQSGTDRIAEALARIEAETGSRHGAVVNVQGDLPTIDPAVIAMALEPVAGGAFDIGTLAAPITEEGEIRNPNVVKPVMSFVGQTRDVGRALYFTRATAPAGEGAYYHHIGLYAYSRAALERFVALPPSPLEQREKLEQLRALEYGMTIGVRVVDTVPLGVDTPADLEKARHELTKGNNGYDRFI